MPRWTHPRLLERLGVFFEHEVDVQENKGTRNTVGEIAADWQTVTGLGSVACSTSNLKVSGVQTGDKKFSMVDSFVVALDGYYPQIDDNMRIVLDGANTYHILSVHHSDDVLTELTVGREQ